MSAEAIAYTETEERQTKRVPYRGVVEYGVGCGGTGKAEWVNVSHSGASLRLGRYLKPGRMLRINTYASEFSGQVVWCHALPDGESFEVGIEMVNEPLEASLTVLAAVARRLMGKVNKAKR